MLPLFREKRHPTSLRQPRRPRLITWCSNAPRKFGRWLRPLIG